MKSYTNSDTIINYNIKERLNKKNFFGLLFSSCLLFFFQNCTDIFSNFRPHKGRSSESRGIGLCSFNRAYLSQDIDLQGSTCLSSNTDIKTKLYFSPGDLALKWSDHRR